MMSDKMQRKLQDCHRKKNENAGLSRNRQHCFYNFAEHFLFNSRTLVWNSRTFQDFFHEGNQQFSTITITNDP